MSCDIIVTIPVSCGRGDTSLKITLSSFMKSSTPKMPYHPSALVIADDIS